MDLAKSINEPPHDKTNKMTVCPAKTQISLGICPDWSESSLYAQWLAKDQIFPHADSEDSDQTGWIPRLIWVFGGHTCHFVGFVMRRLKSLQHSVKTQLSLHIRVFAVTWKSFRRLEKTIKWRLVRLKWFAAADPRSRSWTVPWVFCGKDICICHVICT